MRIGFLADIHEDHTSLLEAITVCEKNNCDEIVCLGDIVGFTLPFSKYINSRDANRCISIIQNTCKSVVAGNHDLYAVRRIPAFSNGFHYESNWYELDYTIRSKLSKNKIWLYEDSELPNILSAESVSYLLSLPEFMIQTYDGMNIMFSHFHYPNLSGSSIGFPRGAKQLQKHFQFMSEHQCSIGISGHGHPEGVAISDQQTMNFYTFGSYELPRDRVWIVCPCIANTTRLNGVVILDLFARVLEIIPLKSQKVIV